MTCISGYFNSNYQCLLADCPKGQFFNETSKLCQDCISPCSTCLNETACTYCISGFNYLDNGSNVCQDNTLSCPAGTFLDTDGYPICRGCPKGCSACTDEVTCTACLTGNFLQDGQCVTSCNSDKYTDPITKECLDCPVECTVCSSTGCT